MYLVMEFENKLLEIIWILYPFVLIIFCLLMVFAVRTVRHHNLVLKMRKRIFEEVEREKQRIANDLHDVIGGTLFRMRTNINGTLLSDEALNGASEIVINTISEIEKFHNELNYTIEMLYPKDLMELEWKRSIFVLCEKMTSKFCYISCKIEVDSIITKNMAVQLYRIIQESLNNILRHADPKFIEVFIDEFDSMMHLELLYPYKNIQLNLDDKSNGGRGKLILNERYKILRAKHLNELKNETMVEQIVFPINEVTL